MDDLHWKEIYQDLKEMTSWYIFPIKKDIYDPMPYLSKLKDWDIVLLDNYFDWWDSPLWNEFLKSYLETNLKCDIIAISDVWEKLTKKFEYWNKANKKWCINWWVTTKKWKDIAEFIKNYYSE